MKDYDAFKIIENGLEIVNIVLMTAFGGVLALCVYLGVSHVFAEGIELADVLALTAIKLLLVYCIWDIYDSFKRIRNNYAIRPKNVQRGVRKKRPHNRSVSR